MVQARLTAELVNALEVDAAVPALFMSAGLAGKAGASLLDVEVVLVVVVDGADEPVPVKADTPPAVVVAPAPALSHGFGGLALLAVAILK